MSDAPSAAAVPEIDPADWRDQFPILSESVYLNNNSLGAMPKSVRSSLSEYADLWEQRGVRAWEEAWWQLPRRVGDLIGSLLGCGPDQVSLHQNVTIAEWIVLSCLEPAPDRHRVVYSELNFPSVRYFYQAQKDLEAVVVPCPDGRTVPLEDLLDAIDERTLLVPISHVIYRSSYLQDVAPIIQKAHSVGAMVVLDVYQSVGSVPIDLPAMGVDFAIGGSVKWLCGGPGVAFLYVRPELAATLEPRLTGWMAHHNPFAFEPEMTYTDGSYRFLNGTPHVPALYAAREGYRIIAEAGVEAIRRRSLKLTERIVAAADELGLTLNSPRAPRQRGGHVSVAPADSESVCRRLLERDFIVDHRPGAGIRISPHFYNTEDEVDAVMAEIRSLSR